MTSLLWSCNSLSLSLCYHHPPQKNSATIKNFNVNESFPNGTAVKNLPANAGDGRDTGLIPGSGRSPGGGHGNPLQYSSLENPVDRGAWQATVHRVTKSWTQLKQMSMHAHMGPMECKAKVPNIFSETGRKGACQSR